MNISEKIYVEGRGNILIARLDEDEEPPKADTQVVFEGKSWAVVNCELASWGSFGISRNIGIVVKEPNIVPNAILSGRIRGKRLHNIIDDNN